MALQQFNVDEEFKGVRVDIFLTQMLEELPSRSYIKKLIDADKVLINKEAIKKASVKLNPGDQIDVDFCETELPDERIHPEEMDLNIFYEDDWFIVLHKPVGLTVHPAAGNYSGTLVNGLVHHFKNLSDVNGSKRPGIVHRLDKDTSGLMVVAKSNMAHARIARQFEKHKVRKEYIALVEGLVDFEEGAINAPIAQHSRYHDHRCVTFDDPLAKQSFTDYRVIKRYEKTTLIRLFPKTGRTHQLRLHMKYLGNPILGDDKYGRKQSFHRLALHAQSLSFLHPANKERVTFSTKMPSDFLL